jgi:opacity protein-like surface antigen
LSNRVLCCVIFLAFSIATACAQSTFKRFNVNVGGGLGIGMGDVGRFVGASPHGVAGFGMNFSRRFGFNAEYMYYDLELKPSVIQNQFLLPGASGNIQSGTLNGIVKVPFFGRWGAYGIFGAGWYQRNVSNRREPLAPGTPCQPAWRWWDLTCVSSGSGSPPVIPTSPPQAISSNSQGAGGFNAGGGVTYPFKRLHARWYIEGRYHRAYHSDGQTTFIPVTIGLRW